MNRRLIIRTIECVLALVLIYSSFGHLNNLFVFLESVYKYKIVFGQAAVFVAIAIPIAQLVLGASLAVRFTPLVSSSLAVIMFGIFTLVQTSAIARGLKIDCGCFGPSSKLISWETVSLAACCLVGAMICLVYEWWKLKREVRNGVQCET